MHQCETITQLISREINMCFSGRGMGRDTLWKQPIKICSRITGSSGLKPLHHSYTILYLSGFQGDKLRIHLRGENEAVEITYIFPQTSEFRID